MTLLWVQSFGNVGRDLFEQLLLQFTLQGRKGQIKALGQIKGHHHGDHGPNQQSLVHCPFLSTSVAVPSSPSQAEQLP